MSEPTSAPQPHRIPGGLRFDGTPATLTDARGQRVVIFTRQSFWRDGRPPNMNRELWAKIKELHMSRGWRWTFRALCFYPLLMVVWVVLAVATRSSSLYLPVFLTGYLSVFALSMWHNWPRRYFRRLSGGLLRMNRCPSCLASLEELAAEHDGCTVCAACGAAWYLPWADHLQFERMPKGPAPLILTGDDRSRMVPPFNPNIWRIDNKTELDIPKEEFATIQRETSKGWHGSTLTRRGATVFACVIGLLIVSDLVLFGVHGIRPHYLLFFGGFLFIALRRWRGVGDDPRVVVDVMKKHQRCGSCGYTLVGVPEEADGCRVCPECGAAWRLVEESAPSPTPSVA